ncbi:DNA topoisomerase I [hydrothermal vent metagenome]|uniref:DNA topoisomerase n=1 Tax=hydrothermal vent metagenome TaxID=652676 RepID=A0A3B1DJJ4_9ZZZZ
MPGVNLEKNFAPTYEVVEGKAQLIRDLKRAAKDVTSSGGEVWFATDLDREGEAIAWHLAQELGIESSKAKRVIFTAITKSEIAKAFSKPHAIDEDRVNAQQARRILDRIVGYQVSPLLWKKVARGLSAGRVQSVAVRLVVEREREIRAFVPDEYWEVDGVFALSEAEAAKLGPEWRALLAERDEKKNPPTVKVQNGWLGERGAFRASLIEIDGKKPSLRVKSTTARVGEGTEGGEGSKAIDLTPRVREIAEAAGLTGIAVESREDEKGKGPARWVRTVSGIVDPSTPYKVAGIETRRTKSRPTPPFITSTLQQAASTRLGFAAQRTMRAAQALYEGVEVPGEGPIGLITYMRTDSTHISGEALNMARDYIGRTYGDAYLPEKPNFYSSSNKAAQEAHEAIRPTSLAVSPDRVKKVLTADQFRLYQLIWERFVACQMMPAQWDATTITIEGGAKASPVLTFRASGRVLVFDGFYRVAGVPMGSDEATLPKLEEKQPVAPVSVEPKQKFTSPPSRYTEASLIKTLEAEGIGRPSTYASIIAVIQNRKYVEQLGRAFYSTDLGEVVTDKLVEAFPRLMDLGYTRQMESQLDQIEDEHLDWTDMLGQFYERFSKSLARAHEELGHAKAEVVPAPEEYRCEKCGSSLVYRFGKNGRFLSCATYPECKYAAPCDREGKPRTVDVINVRCPKSGRPMARRTGRFGPFLATILPEGTPQDEGIILNIDKKGFVTAPSQPPILTELECEKCGKPLNLRNGARGPWLGCSGFPKCRGRGKWASLDEGIKAGLEAELEAHDKAHPIPIITTLDGRPLTEKNGKPLKDAPTVDQLVLESLEEAERLAANDAAAVA